MPGGMTVRTEPRFETTSSCCCQKNNQSIFQKNRKISSNKNDNILLSDTTFLREIAIRLLHEIPQRTEHQVTVDTKRIYMSGHGNGCWMAHAMAAYHSDMVAAVACMAGMTLTAIEPQKDVEHYEPVPSWTIVGALDEIVPPGGLLKSTSEHERDMDVWKFPSPQAGFEYLTKLHGCQEVINHATMIPEMDIPDYPLAGALYVQTAQRCNTKNAAVQHLTLATAGHDVYQQRNNRKQFSSTTTPTMTASYTAETTIDTTQLAWEFASSYQRDREPVLESTTITTTRKYSQEDDKNAFPKDDSDDAENPLWMMAIPTTAMMESSPNTNSGNHRKETVPTAKTDGNFNKRKRLHQDHDKWISLQQQFDLNDDMLLLPDQNESTLHPNKKLNSRTSLRGKIDDSKFE
jgi:poly(3-hydroxybutyrate) depolymerase